MSCADDEILLSWVGNMKRKRLKKERWKEEWMNGMIGE